MIDNLRIMNVVQPEFGFSEFQLRWIFNLNVGFSTSNYEVAAVREHNQKLARNHRVFSVNFF
jgi:hypothetical protein